MAPAGERIENILALDSPPVNLLHPDESESTANPAFEISQPAPIAFHDKDGPSHSFNSVNVRLTNDTGGPSDTVLIENTGFARNFCRHPEGPYACRGS